MGFIICFLEFFFFFLIVLLFFLPLFLRVMFPFISSNQSAEIWSKTRSVDSQNRLPNIDSVAPPTVTLDVTSVQFSQNYPDSFFGQ